MAIGGAFLGGGVEVVPAGSCKLELEILTEDRANLAATFTIKGTSTYTVTAGADGRAVYTVPAGQTYTVSVNTTGYDNIASQTVIAESGTVRYVRFEAIAGRVKRSGDTMSGNLTVQNDSVRQLTLKNTSISMSYERYKQVGIIYGNASDGVIGKIEILRNTPSGFLGSGVIISAYNSTKTQQALSIYSFDDGVNQEAYVQHPSWKVGTNDNSDKSLTIKMANSLPSLVHTTGNETKTGTLTLTSKLYANGDVDMWSSLVIGTAPSSTLKKTIAIKDSEGTWYGEISSAVQSNKTTSVFLRTRKWDSSVNTFADLGVNILADGTAYASAPTPSNKADNSTKIATTAWVNTASLVVHTSGVEEVKGFKKFTNTQWGGGGVAYKDPRYGIANSDNPLYNGKFKFISQVPLFDANEAIISNDIIQTNTDNSIERVAVMRDSTNVQRTLYSIRLNSSDGGMTMKLGTNPPSDANGKEVTTANWAISKFVQKSGDETIEGIKTFNSSPVVPSTSSDATGSQIATANWAYDKFQRKISYGTGDPPSGGQAGDIYIKI